MLEPVYMLHEGFGMFSAHVFVLSFMFHEYPDGVHPFVDNLDLRVLL